MAILLVFHILNISDILIMPHNYDVGMDTGDHVRFTWEDVQIDNQPQNKKISDVF